jgi:hypothetical protein
MVKPAIPYSATWPSDTIPTALARKMRLTAAMPSQSALVTTALR